MLAPAICAAALFHFAGLGRVGGLVPHDRVDHLQPLPRDRLQRLAVAHPAAPARAVVLAESVRALRQRVA